MTDFTKEHMQQFYNDILVRKDISKFDDYFCNNCYININGKEFDNDKFKQRMQWLKENIKKVEVEIVNFFVSGDGKWITDSHISKTEDDSGKKSSFFVIQQSSIEDGKIKSFVDATYALDENSNLNIAYAK